MEKPLIQSFEMCRYSVHGSPGDSYSKELNKHGLHAAYVCENPEMLQLEIYPIIKCYGNSGVTNGSLLEVIVVEKALTRESAKSISRDLRKVLNACNHCKFFEPR
jgi:hypothetical protein